tara:strand:+ start:241 stop:363 length:123 start_codon:yes stop_codon:yes gene_type:complete
MSCEHNIRLLEQLFEQCLDEGMTDKQAEIEAWKRFSERGI